MRSLLQQAALSGVLQAMLQSANLCSCPSDQRGVTEAAPPEETVAETDVLLSAERALGNEEVAVAVQEQYSAEPVHVHQCRKPL